MFWGDILFLEILNTHKQVQRVRYFYQATSRRAGASLTEIHARYDMIRSEQQFF